MNYYNFLDEVIIAKAWDSIDAYPNDGEMELIVLMEIIEWICLIIDGIIFLYIYNIYRKGRNKNNNNESIILKASKIVIIIFAAVNIILVILKVINMFLI